MKNIQTKEQLKVLKWKLEITKTDRTKKEIWKIKQMG